jgi:hypothetical protein
VLHGVKAWAFGEHPTRENALHLAGELDLIHLDEGRGMGRLGRRARIAHARRYLQGAELHGLIDRNLQMGNAARYLVQRGEDCDGILDFLRKHRVGIAHDHGDRQQDQGKPQTPAPVFALLLRHAAPSHG